MPLRHSKEQQREGGAQGDVKRAIKPYLVRAARGTREMIVDKWGKVKSSFKNMAAWIRNELKS